MSSSFQDDFNSAQNSAKQAQSAISAGIIAAIVIAAVVGIGSAVGCFCLYRRQKKARAARMAPFEPKYDASNGYNQQGPFVSPSQQYAPVYNPNQPSEAPGHAVEPRWEAPYTPAALPEVHAHEAKGVSPITDHSRHELTGSNAQRSELSA